MRYLSERMKERRGIIEMDLAKYGPKPGPGQASAVSLDEARAYCRRLAGSHYENFSVLSPLVPERCRADFAAVYAFCRWADDLADESGSRDRALELLAWWRGELEALGAGEARHPVFVALRESFARCGLEAAPFGDLISAFELDQTKARYATWDEVLGYCRLSANPVGRIVLRVLGERCVLGDKSSVKRSVLGCDVRLGAGAKVINSVLMDGVVLGDGCHVQSAVVCRGAVVQERSTLKECEVGPGFLVAQGSDHRGETLARS